MLANKLSVFMFIIALSCFPLWEIFTTPHLPHTSDGAMHVTRFASFYKEFIAGQFPVRWASQYNYGYGMPLFNFFHPLPYIISLPATALGIPLVLTLKLSFLLTYIAAGIGMYLFANAFFKNEKVALLITILYQFAPFRLVEMLVRGSLGSLYAYALVPFALYAITVFVKKRSSYSFALVCVSIALLTMSHNVVGFLFLLFTIIFSAILSMSLKTKILIWIAILWGLSLSGFYLIPAVMEQKYTYAYLLTKDLFYDHFAPLYKFFVPNIFNDPKLRTAEVSVQIGIFHVMTLVYLFSSIIMGKVAAVYRNLAIFLIFATLATIAFMQPITQPLWENISFLRKFQFPWRLLSILTVTSALSAFALSGTKIITQRGCYYGFIILTIISTIYYWTPYQGYQIVSQEYFWNFPRSTNYFGEINSIWMAGEPVNFPKDRVHVAAGNAVISNTRTDSIRHSFTVDALEKTTIVDHTQFYPGWKVRSNGREIPIEFQNQMYRGLITFTLDPGRHNITVTFEGNKLHKLSNLLSVVSAAALLVGSYLFSKYPAYEEKIFS